MNSVWLKKTAVFLVVCALIFSGCKTKPEIEEPTWRLLKQKAVVFEDGNYADLFAQDYSGTSYKYRLPDGTDLLTENTYGPDSVYVLGIESLDDVDDADKEKIKDYYNKRGLLYDIESEVKRAYEEYLRCSNSDDEFSSFMVDQSVSPTASNENIICFITTVLLSIDSKTGQEIRLGEVFDRNTGEYIDNWQLFSISEAEVRAKFHEIFNIKDTALADEMRNAIKAENIIVFPGKLQVDFPQGVLTSQKYSYIVSAEMYKILDCLQPWAIMDDNKY